MNHLKSDNRRMWEENHLFLRALVAMVPKKFEGRHFKSRRSCKQLLRLTITTKGNSYEFYCDSENGSLFITKSNRKNLQQDF